VYNPYSSRPRGQPSQRSAVRVRVFRGSQNHNTPPRRGYVPQHGNLPRTFVPRTPELHVTISNSDVEEPVEAAYAEQQRLVELLSDDCGGGDFKRQPIPAATSVPRPQFVPAVAQLFSSFSQNSRSTRDEISELLDVYPQGIELSNFCRVFEACFHRPFDSRWSDASSLRQMLERMVDLIECVELGNEVIVRKKNGTGYFQGNALHVSAIIM